MSPTDRGQSFFPLRVHRDTRTYHGLSVYIAKFDLILKSNSLIHSKYGQGLKSLSCAVMFSCVQRHSCFIFPFQLYFGLRKYRSFRDLHYILGFLDFCAFLFSLKLTLNITLLMKYTYKPSNQLPRYFLKVNTQLKMQSP